MAFSDDLQRGIDRAIKMVQFDRAAIAEIAEDPNAINAGLAIVAIAGVAEGIGVLRARGIVGLMVSIPFVLLVSVLCVALWYVVGLVVKPPSWDFMQLYRAVAHSYIIGWVCAAQIIPFIGMLIGLLATVYQIAVVVVTVQTVGKTDLPKALIIVLLPMVLCCGLALAVAGILGVAAIGGLRQIFAH